ncbi:transposase [Rhodococcus rhodochrous]|uniref:transposase n=1 Tax=Rhodococcus rhodochrous TaxID=1829 RepID=UPI00128ECE84
MRVSAGLLLRGEAGRLVDADGYRETLGLYVTSKGRAGWRSFLRSARPGVSGATPVTLDACAGWCRVGATPPGSSSQRCRTHHAAKSSWSEALPICGRDEDTAAFGLRRIRR